MSPQSAQRFLRRASIAAMNGVLSSQPENKGPGLFTPQSVAALSVEYAVNLLAYVERVERDIGRNQPAAVTGEVDNDQT